MTDAKLQRARAAAEKAAQELAALEAEESAKAAQIAAERAAREIEYAHRVKETWRAEEEQNSEAEKAARARFYELVAEEPWFVAFAEYRAHRFKRGHILNTAQGAQSRLGETVTVPENRIYDATIMDDVINAAEQRAREIAADFADELDARRESFVNGEA
ncbi:hypothetical protein N4G69_22190 [Streptomyces mirabilis]|uniref:hypothetical protein n=1 Tax=Streptomyces mirabilis TaxID=68239 RepID=UPI0021C1749E|nr:hypothetical protein [Streptomyces mirabilis]MCT9108309.1 hypothetical protein [Streptomyces mirabilis]